MRWSQRRHSAGKRYAPDHCMACRRKNRRAERAMRRALLKIGG